MMAKPVQLSLQQLSNENRVTFDGFPATLIAGASTAIPTDGVECIHRPKKSFTIETDGACNIYIQGRIGTSGEWCTQKKAETDSDLKFTCGAGGASILITSIVPMDYIRLWITNTAGATLTINDVKVKLGR